MNKQLFFMFLCFVVLCLADTTHQKSVRVRRQGEGLLFPVDLEDRYGWENNNNRPNNNRPNGNRPNGNRPNGNRPNNGNNQQTTTSSTTTAATAVTPDPACMATCIKTPEYNPVCGSNSESYTNVSFLSCARRCGVPNLTLLRMGRCPRPATK